MNKIFLTETAKKLLLYINEHREYVRSDFPEESVDELSLAAGMLKLYGLITVSTTDQTQEIYVPTLTDEGRNYLYANPGLDNPISEEVEKLTCLNLVLQNESLEDKRKIRRQETIIRWHKVFIVIAGVLGYIVHLLAIPFK